MKTSIRVGNGCGFWGDNLDAPVLLARDGQLDYLTLEYLAELTMSILALQKQRDAEAGFAADFLDVLARLTPVLHAQPNLRIVTNAGGMNPQACARRAKQILTQAGLADRRIAVVSGDDLLPRLDELLRAGHPFTNLDTGAPLADVRPRVVSANAYLGAKPIADALTQGAAIVITGRVADASLTVAPAVYEFGWSWNEWNRLGAATVAGHLIECGAQVTGGLWCNWQQAPDLANVGYPIAEMEPTGRFRITKPKGSGGAVNRETVSEQLLYEVGDPGAYLTPDVVADFTAIALREVEADAVEIDSARGRPATDTYKVSIAYRDGYSATGMLAIFGPGAADKARRCGEMLLHRLERAGHRCAGVSIECIGDGAVVPLPAFRAGQELREVMLRVSVHDAERAAVERFTKEFAPLVTSGPPGVTGYTTGRPQVREVFAYWPALIAKSVVEPVVAMVH
jgi:hypothetical protein